MTLSSTKPTRTGYTFQGWATSASGSVAYQPGAVFTADANTTLYAVWQKGCENAKHQYTYSVTAPTCTADGYTAYTCTLCGDSYTEAVAATGHKETILAAKAPTCTETGLTEGKKCTVCNTVTVKQNVVDALGHVEVIDKAVAATCTSTGLTEGKKCAVCNTITKAQEVVPAKGHTEKTLAAVAPTCTATGLTEGTQCTVCNVITKEQTTVDALGHVEVIDKAIAATCTTSGLTEGKHCSRCDAVLVAQQTVAAKGHTEVTDAAVAPDCTNTGLTEGKHCSVCNEVLAAQTVVAALGHSYLDGTCTRCGGVDPDAAVDENAPQVVLDSKKASQGSTVSVDFKVLNNPGFSVLNVAFLYDSQYLTLTSVENKVPSMVMTQGASVLWDSAANYTANGLLATLSFTVAEDAPEGDYEIRVVFMGASNEDFEEVKLAAVSGVLTVSDLVYGDANGDGQVTTVDLAMLRKYLAGMDPVTGVSSVEIKAGGDCNGDGTVNTIDLAMLRKYLAGVNPITGESSVVLGPK